MRHRDKIINLIIVVAYRLKKKDLYDIRHFMWKKDWEKMKLLVNESRR